MRSEAECVIRNHPRPAFTKTVNLAPHFLSENELLASIWQCQIVACQSTGCVRLIFHIFSTVFLAVLPHGSGEPLFNISSYLSSELNATEM